MPDADAPDSGFFMAGALPDPANDAMDPADDAMVDADDNVVANAVDQSMSNAPGSGWDEVDDADNDPDQIDYRSIEEDDAMDIDDDTAPVKPSWGGQDSDDEAVDSADTIESPKLDDPPEATDTVEAPELDNLPTTLASKPPKAAKKAFDVKNPTTWIQALDDEADGVLKGRLTALH